MHVIICAVLFSAGIYCSENLVDVESYSLSQTAVSRKQWPKVLANYVLKLSAFRFET